MQIPVSLGSLTLRLNLTFDCNGCLLFDNLFLTVSEVLSLLRMCYDVSEVLGLRVISDASHREVLNL